MLTTRQNEGLPVSEDRKLATIRTVDRIEEIPGADAIEAAVFGGWRCVVLKGTFAPGDQGVYLEIDSALPLSDPRFAFLEPRGRKEIDGVAYHVLRTIRLRGVFSQGLALRLDEVPETLGEHDDLAAAMGIVKYETPMPDELVGSAVGAFPAKEARKTGADRVQNLADAYASFAANPHEWEATEKVDGTSSTFIITDDGMRIAGRQWEWEIDDDLPQAQYAARERLTDHISAGHVIQGELYGPGIGGNKLGVDRFELAVFAVWRDGAQLPFGDWPRWAAERAAPIHDLTLPATLDEALAQADGIESLLVPGRRAEGIVWRRRDAQPVPELSGRSVFKVISNSYLLGKKGKR